MSSLFDNLLFDFRYALMRKPKARTWVQYHWKTGEELADHFRRNGIAARDLYIDIEDYREYLARANYRQYEYYANAARATFAEKTLEHYLAAKLLRLNAGDVYIDIANDHAPTPEIYNRLYGCRTYRQDIVFPPGLNGNRIGGNAANLPLPDSFASAMALHCSFEHFEGDNDIGFLREAGRVLKPGGRLCIVPLYLFYHYAILTDPLARGWSGVKFEPEATVHFGHGYGNRHGRFYDLVKFHERVMKKLGPLEMTLYAVRNQNEVDPACYVKFVAVFEKA